MGEHKAATGEWPNPESSQVTGTDETWAGINASLKQGRRGLPSGSSLAKLLAEHRSVRNRKDLPPLTIEQILEWADEHKAATGESPTRKSGRVTGTNETWARIDRALQAGVRTLAGGSSLPKLLAEHRHVRNTKDLPPLTVEQILAWMDAHKAATGGWPNKNSGPVTGTDETWAGVGTALNRGRRGLTAGSSLIKLLGQPSVRTTRDLD